MKKRTVVVSVSASVLAVAGMLPQVASYASPHHPAGAPKALLPATSHRMGKAGLYDARQNVSRQQQAVIANHALRAAATPAVQALRRSLGDQADIQMNGTTGTPRIVAKLNGFLTRPSSKPAAEVALGYVRNHPDIFKLTSSDFSGLRLARDYVDIAGTSHLSWVQTKNGVPLFDNGLKANVAKNGQLINVEGSPVSGLRAPAAPATLSPRNAIVAAKTNLGTGSTAPGLGDVSSHVLFAVGNTTRAAYQVTVMDAARPSLLVVDARSGRVLFRESITADERAPSSASATSAAKPIHDQRALVYSNYPGAARGGKAKPVDLTSKGWLPARASVLFGNNVHTYTDVNDNNHPDPREEVKPMKHGSYEFKLHRFRHVGVEPCRKYVCDWNPNVKASWMKNRRQTATQNFYYINKYHDHLRAAPIGFTEAAGNFQEVNHTGKGVAEDPVQDESLDGARTGRGMPDGNHIDNANFATPPDGQAPRMQMYLFHFPGAKYPNQDPFLATAGSSESDVVYHEYTHGLSHRLVVDTNDVPALDSQQGASMGEAWSDWYALDYLVNEGLLKDRPHPNVHIGGYVDGPLKVGQTGLRTEDIDCKVGSLAKYCPGTQTAGHGGYTYGDFGNVIGAPEVHADGEIWGQTLWDLRDALGSKRTESIVTRGMELSPTFPSYLDMRNAIIQADVADYNGKDVHTIWKVFAHRGMGFFAGSVGGDDVHPVQDFHLPPAANAPKGNVTGVVTDSVTGDPVKGAVVGFGGHDSGFPGSSYVAVTNAQGRYTIKHVFTGKYPDVYAGGAGYVPQVVNLTVTKGTTTKNWTLDRDWAAASGGASIADTTDNSSAPFGCGAAQLIDLSLGLGWSANNNGGSQYTTIKLPQPIDITQLKIDPSNTCGDDVLAAAGNYSVETSTDGSNFVPAAAGQFTPNDNGQLVTVPLAPGSDVGVQYIRYTISSNQATEYGVDCTQTPYEGCGWYDSQEVEAFGAATPTG